VISYNRFVSESGQSVESWLARFELHPQIQPHVEAVLHALPQPVLADLMEDPAFVLCDYEPDPGRGVQVPVGWPGANGSSRSVVLKRTLRRRPAAFVRWLIAHELAHAHLRNEGREPGEDPEQAADALAAQWGFPRPG
jgi:hypothetical protein